MKTRIRGTFLMITAMSVLLALGSCGAPKETVTSCRSLSVGEVKSAGMTDSVMQTGVTVTQSRHSVNGTARTTVVEQSQTVPESSATLTVTMTNLRDLPEGASYRASDGRAGIELMRHGDEIYATGHCDSVSRLYRYYFDMNLRQSETVDSLMWELDRSRAKQATLARELAGLKAGEAVSESRPACRWPLWFISGFVAGLAAGFLIRNAGYILPFLTKFK